MNQGSNYTKKTRLELWALRIVDALILCVPLFVYLIMGFIGDGATHEKVALVGSVAIALILTIFNILAKTHLRSAIWILLLGVYVAVDNLMPLIICLAVGTMIDEFVLSPLIHIKKTELISNKTIDARGL